MEEFEGLLVKPHCSKKAHYALANALENADGALDCVIRDRYLSAYIFRLPKDTYTIRVTGRRNKRNQLLVKHMTILNVDEYIKVIGTPE